ncbi:hypothetical protein TOPH_07470 [Tolypocladium ophioglossoides CBS 100239]|uniref:Uncharacterized protein n=1 Tax=Tolypocladium ophioglossoides (strain CBS 100239) TaxID=1163406 RepID=A0A0L0N1E1_TOLOC|nr:hypothetical protein TOPH_07470 [Tolypocladium ophioglossoides CBS 100239]
MPSKSCQRKVSKSRLKPKPKRPSLRNLIGQVDLLGNLHVASLDGAFEVDVADLLTEVRLGVNKSDEAVLDAQLNIHPLDFDDVVAMLAVTELQGTLSRDPEAQVCGGIGGIAVEDTQRRRRCQAGGQASDGKPHCVGIEVI